MPYTYMNRQLYTLNNFFKLNFRLQNQTGVNLDLLNIPDHVVPASFYQIHLPGLSTEGSQHSIGKLTVNCWFYVQIPALVMLNILFVLFANLAIAIYRNS